MDQEKLIDAVEEGILEKLPESAIIELANLADQPGNHDEEVRAILREHQVDPEAVAKDVIGKD